MRPKHFNLLKRTAATILDGTIEILGGFLGSYFGMMVAALLVSLREGPADQMQASMWSGFGFGLIFWTLSLSFLNRVLIQGLSRSSIGKKIFNLELISVGKPITWFTILKRWVMALGSIAIFGIGYFYAFFERKGRTFHDIVCQTQVISTHAGAAVSLDYAVPLVVVAVKAVQNTVQTVDQNENNPVDLTLAKVIQMEAKAKVLSLAELVELDSEGQDDDTKAA